MDPIKLFVTGTDTNCGKTYVTQQLLQGFKQLGLRTTALKPVASDCQVVDQGFIPASFLKSDGYRNQDALILQQASTVQLPYKMVNPVAFLPPISPNIAAEQIHFNLTVEKLISLSKPGLEIQSDIVLVEGCGGWMCPLNQQETMADYVRELKMPVILVVGLRLGCLNHSLLTWNLIRQDKIPFAGWIANQLDEKMLFLRENIQTLQSFLGSPPLAFLPHQQSFNKETSQAILRQLQTQIVSKV